MLELSIFHLLKMNLAIQQLNRHYEQSFGLSIVQWHLLKHLVDLPGTPATVLAHAAGVHPSTLTQSLRRLLRKKYIFATNDPKDSRKKILSITREGKEMLDQLELHFDHGLPGLKNFSQDLCDISDYLAHRLANLRETPDAKLLAPSDMRTAY